MSRRGNKRNPRYQWAVRGSDYVGAESLNWREPVPEHPPVKPVISTAHQECVDFLYKGWGEFELEKRTQGSEVKVHDEETALPRNPPLNLDEWIKKHSTRH